MTLLLALGSSRSRFRVSKVSAVVLVALFCSNCVRAPFDYELKDDDLFPLYDEPSDDRSFPFSPIYVTHPLTDGLPQVSNGATTSVWVTTREPSARFPLLESDVDVVLQELERATNIPLELRVNKSKASELIRFEIFGEDRFSFYVLADFSRTLRTGKDGADQKLQAEGARRIKETVEAGYSDFRSAFD